MEIVTRLDIFEPGDRTAIVCIDVPEMQRIVVEQLTELGYKLHTGFSTDDIILKLRAQNYDLIIIAENFGASTVDTNPLLLEAVNAPASQRQKQFLVVVGASFTTNDEMQAFKQSVDLVVSLEDFVHLRPLLRRGVSRAQEFYSPLHDVLQNTGRA